MFTYIHFIKDERVCLYFCLGEDRANHFYLSFHFFAGFYSPGKFMILENKFESILNREFIALWGKSGGLDFVLR